MRSALALALLFFCCAVLLSSCKQAELFRRAGARPAFNGPRVGLTVPEIDGEDFDGKRLKLSDQRGKVVVLVFWASWCKPCRDLIPHERELAERYRNKPFVLLGVNNDDNFEAARKVIAAERMNWPIWKTGAVDHAINRDWCVNSWPAVFVIDTKGVLRYTRVSGQHLDNAVATLLAEKNE